MIYQLRHRNFILCYLGADSYASVHRTFLEYFCAGEFVWQFKETQTLTIDRLINDVFAPHWQDETWHEVLLLICGSIDAKFVAEIVDYLLEQKIDRSKFLDEYNRQTKEGLGNLILAANCFVEVRNKQEIPTTSILLMKALYQEIEQEYPYQFDSETALDLMSMIVNISQNRAEILQWLKDCLNYDISSFIPGGAVQAIAQFWQDDSDTLPWLKHCAQHNNYTVMYLSVVSIAQFWQDDPDTLPWLKHCAQHGHKIVRLTATRSLAKGWKENPQMFEFLCNIAIHDCFQRKHSSEDNPRKTALIAVLENYPDRPEILDLLRDRSINDADEQVRKFAERELAKLTSI